MKTFILASVSTAALLLAGAASASTTQTDAQVDAGRAAVLAQRTASSPSVPNGQGNYQTSYINQTDNSNQATVDQTNSGTEYQSSTIIQGWSEGTSTGNGASVTQSGSDDTAVIQQLDYSTGNGGNSATTSQSGTKNNAFTYQKGYKNAGTVTQSGQNTLPSGMTSSSVTDANSAPQGTGYANSFHGADESLSHLQDLGGRVIQDQQANTDAGTVSQTGVDDRGTVVQTANNNSNAQVNQAGTNNAAVSYQSSDGSTVIINQTSGTGSKADVAQLGNADGFSGSAGLQGYITQAGDANAALIKQSGNTNYSSITENSSNGQAASTQSGSQQTSYITQKGPYDGALTEQTGTNNYAQVAQNNYSDYSYVSQNGTGAQNQALITQDHSQTFSAVYQNGGNNYANVHQH